MISRLAIGTAQFGFAYGISNVDGQPSAQECGSILALARKSGIDTLDTAIAYGESENVLGAIGVRDWQVVTKLPALPESIAHNVGEVTRWVDARLEQTMARLRVDRLYGVLLHEPSQLLSDHGESIYRVLTNLRERGRVSRIGISIYEPTELDRLPQSMQFDIVQAPMNILDLRMIRSGWASRLAASGCEFHARSIFLQGLLLMTAQSRPGRFDRWNPLWRAWDRWLADNRISALQGCLRFALQVPHVSKLVVGVNSVAQLTQVLAAAEGVVPSPPAELSTEDPALLNPALWPTS